MTGPWPPATADTESETEFLTRVLTGINTRPPDHPLVDALSEQLTNRLCALGNRPAHDAGSEPADGWLELLAVELHRLRRDQATVTFRTCGGFTHHDLHVVAVRRHCVLVRDSARDDGPGFLLPLAYIESVHAQPAPPTVSTPALEKALLSCPSRPVTTRDGSDGR
ncbi:hypothetical protein ACIBCD_14930 [Nocardia brasiliensis]|uniref:hypothetical protein n=1 Tax=Nocardia brasiliensis TaxID=37326 RepID=UPI0037BAE41E